MFGVFPPKSSLATTKRFVANVPLTYLFPSLLPFSPPCTADIKNIKIKTKARFTPPTSRRRRRCVLGIKGDRARAVDSKTEPQVTEMMQATRMR